MAPPPQNLDPGAPLAGPRAASKWATFAVTFLGSLGTGAAINGIYFIATEVYDFARIANWTLAIVSSLAYVGAALLAGPALRRLQRSMPGQSSRTILILIALAMAGCCSLPYFVRHPWTIWAFMGLYATLSGAFWPIVEAFVSGGRRGSELRRTMGGFNIVWSVAVALSFWMMSPIMPRGPLIIIALLGLTHIVTIPILATFPKEPGRHHDLTSSHTDEEAALYRRLLHGFRVLLLLSYALMSTINPVLPLRLRELGIPLAYQTLLASIWMTVRIGVFALMMVWHGWHGRVRTMVWSSGAMLIGFGCVMLGPDVFMLALGLTLLGVGVGAAYSAAIYYAMEAGPSEVDAGGKHEALIGAGYLAGPGLSLMAAGALEPGSRDLATAIAVGCVALLLTLFAFRLAKRSDTA